MERDDLPTLVGHVLGDEIGSGGMGTVHVAIDEKLQRQLAIKVLHDEFAEQPDVLGRFVSEARLAAGLEHPSIVPIHAVGMVPDTGPVFTMKLVKGETLHDRLRTRRRPPRGEEIDAIVDVLVKLCEALSYAHSHGVVHGDLKSRNVMLGEHGEVYLMDWGNARRVGSPAPTAPDGRPLVLGTLAMLAPEQARCEPVDARTDVFGMGALLYTLLARRVPYGRGGAQGRIDAAREGRFAPLEKLAPRAPAALREIVQSAMQLDPDLRYQSVGHLRQALVAYQRRRVPAPRVSVAKGEVLIRQGDPSDAIYIVISGRFSVTQDIGLGDLALAECGPGEVLGEIGLLARGQRTATVTAMQDSEVYALDLRRVEEELERTAPWMRSLIHALATRLHARATSDASTG